MLSRVFLHALHALCFAIVAQCQCYLEDAEATCAVCWITQADGTTVLRQCPDGISIEWNTQLPSKMYENTDYATSYTFKIDRSLFDLDYVLESYKGEIYQVPHSNIHSCVKSAGVCSPFVADSPGLSTHTGNDPANFSVSGDTNFQKFDTNVRLPEDEYTIIAHTRIYVTPKFLQSAAPCSPNCKLKYDIVVGISRNVLREPKSASTDSYVTAGVVGVLLLGALASIVWASRSGKLDIEAVVVALTREEVALMSGILIQTGDMVAFTMCVKQDVMDNNDMADTVPICIVFLVVGWLAAVICVQKASSNLYNLWESQYRTQRYWDKQIVRDSVRALVFSINDIENAFDSNQFVPVPDKSARDKPQMTKSLTFGARLAKSLIAMSAFRQYDKSRRQLSGQYISILTMLLADLPMVVVSMYILYKVDSGEIAVILSLVFSVMLLTSKASHLGRFSSNLKEVEIAMKAVREVANGIGTESLAMHTFGRESLSMTKVQSATDSNEPQFVVREPSIEVLHEADAMDIAIEEDPPPVNKTSDWPDMRVNSLRLAGASPCCRFLDDTEI